MDMKLLNPPSGIDDLARFMDSRFLKALAEPVRIEILKHLILIGRSDIAAIARSFPQDRSVISRHLSIMREAGILVSIRQGRQVLYEINGSYVLERLKQITAMIEGSIQKHCCG